MTGLYYGYQNNPRPTVSLVLAGNLDVVDPAHALPISITWSEATVRGEVLSSALFAVTRVSVEHYNDADGAQPPKTVTWALEQVTDFAPGETAPVRQMIGVTPPAEGTCSVSAAFSSSVADATVTFTDASTGDLLMRWRWDFGDGGYSNLRNPVHVYGATGTYSVTLTVISACGAYDTATHDVTITSSVGLWAVGRAVIGSTVTAVGYVYALEFDGDWGVALAQGVQVAYGYPQDGATNGATSAIKYVFCVAGLYQVNPYTNTSALLESFPTIFGRAYHFETYGGIYASLERIRVYTTPDDPNYLLLTAGYTQCAWSFDGGANWDRIIIFTATGGWDATAQLVISTGNTSGGLGEFTPFTDAARGYLEARTGRKHGRRFLAEPG